jgi:hypothetical protein
MKTLAEIFRAALPYYTYSKHPALPYYTYSKHRDLEFRHESYFCDAVLDAYCNDLISEDELYFARYAIRKSLAGNNYLTQYFSHNGIDPTAENRMKFWSELCGEELE